MERCTYCGREANSGTKHVHGYTILEVCTDCERELNDENDKGEGFGKELGQ